jgi:hypothetical protein
MDNMQSALADLENELTNGVVATQVRDHGDMKFVLAPTPGVRPALRAVNLHHGCEVLGDKAQIFQLSSEMGKIIGREIDFGSESKADGERLTPLLREFATHMRKLYPAEP